MSTEAGSSIEQFNIENPPKACVDEDDDYSNQNIVFQGDVSTCEYNEDTKELQKAYCGITGDSELSAILNVVVSAIGANCFNFAYILQDAGLLYALFMFLFVTICIYYSIDLLRSFIVDTKYYSFALMTEKILGPRWLKLYAISSLIVYLSMVVNCENMIYSYVTGILEQIIKQQKNEDNTTSSQDEDVNDDIPVLFKLIYYVGSAVAEILICIFTKNTKIHLLSIVALSCFSFILLCIIIVSIKKNITGEVTGKFTENSLLYPKEKHGFTGTLDVLSNFVTFVYGYCYHSTFPTLMGNLYIVNESTTKRVHIISFASIFCAFFLITFFGFLYEKDVPIVLFIQNIQKIIHSEFILIVFKIILSLFFFTLIPIRFMIVRDNYTTLIGKKKVTPKKEMIWTSLFIIVSNIIVILLNLNEKEKYQLEITKFIQIFGGIFGVIICFFCQLLIIHQLTVKLK